MEGYISTIECACGCQTLIPQHLVDLGWRFLRGHKPQKAAVAKRERKHRPVQQIGLSQIMDFALRNVEMLTDQLEVQRAVAVKAQNNCTTLETQIAQWRAVLENGRRLAGLG